MSEWVHPFIIKYIYNSTPLNLLTHRSSFIFIFLYIIIFILSRASSKHLVFLYIWRRKKKIPPHSPHFYKLLYIENKIKYKIQNSQLLILVPIVSYHRRPVAIWRRKAYLSFHTLIPRLLLFSLVFVYIKDIIENIYKYIHNNNNTQHIILKITTE